MTLLTVLQKKYQKQVQRPPHSVWTNPVHFITCGFGIGTFPWFPGTAATLAAIPLVIILSHLPLLLYLFICAALFLIGIPLCEITNRDFGEQDHPAAVIDEIATFPIALIGLPISWPYLVAAFLLFRFFDIVKPGPIGFADKQVHGGFGVMLDDALAALATLAILHLFHSFS